MIYIVRAGETEMTKIGFAVDIPNRIKAIQPGCWERLNILREMPGDVATEGWMHRHFREHRVQREWFKFHPDMLTIEPPSLYTTVANLALADYLKANNLSQTEFAASIGVDQSAVNRWLSAARFPRGEALARIIAVTGGAVTADSFLPVIS